MRRHDEMTHEEERRLDAEYLAGVRALARPAGAHDLERFSADYRRVLERRYPNQFFNNNQRKETTE